MDDQKAKRDCSGAQEVVYFTRSSASLMLVAVGVAAIPFATHLPLKTDHEAIVAAAVWVVGGTMIGAGLLNPFRLAPIGAIIGFFFQVFWLALLASQLEAL